MRTTNAGVDLGRKSASGVSNMKLRSGARHGDDVPQPRNAGALGSDLKSTISLTQVLLGANVAVFLAMMFGGGSADGFHGHA